MRFSSLITPLVPALLVSLTACGRDDPVGTLLICRDQACCGAALLAAWEADRPRVEAWLVALPPEDGRDLLVEQLALTQPGDAARICGLLPKTGDAANRCAARVDRPHLQPGSGRKVGEEEVAAGSAAGPRSTTLGVPALPPPPWAAATEAEYGSLIEGCDQPEPALCGRFAARARAERGDLSGAGLACVAADPARGQAYSECLFQAAEAMAEARGAEGFGPALTLCAASSFSPMCVAHILTLIGPRVPAADDVTADDVAGALAAVAAIRAATEGSPRQQASYIDWYWSTWTGTTWRWARRVDGRVAAMLPAEARPHVAVAVAARLVRDEHPDALQLEPFVEKVRAALADPGGPAPGSPAQRRYRLLTQIERESWNDDIGKEKAFPAAWVMGPGRRAVAPDDPETDLLIATLVAVSQAKNPPPAGFFLDLAGQRERPLLVRWAAARIGAALDPAAASALTDPEPLVQLALGSGRKKPNPGP